MSDKDTRLMAKKRQQKSLDELTELERFRRVCQRLGLGVPDAVSERESFIRQEMAAEADSYLATL